MTWRDARRVALAVLAGGLIVTGGRAVAGEAGKARRPATPEERAPLYQAQAKAARLAKEKRYDEAIAAYKVLYQDMLRVLGDDVLDPCMAMGSMADLYGRRGMWPEAEAACKTVLETHERVIGPRAAHTGEATLRLGEAILEQGRRLDAEPVIERACSILKSHTPQFDYVYSRAMLRLAQIRGFQGRWDEVEELSDANFRLHRRMDAKSLVRLSLDMVTAAEDLACFQLGFTLARQRADVPGKAAKFAEWQLNSKVFRREVFARQMAELNAARDKPQVEAREKLRAVRGRLAGLALKPVAPGTTRAQLEARAEQLRDLTKEEKKLAQAAARATGRADADFQARWIRLEEVRAAVPADAVLIDLISYPEYDFHAQPGTKAWKTAHHLAFVIPPTGRGEVRLIDLNDHDALYPVSSLLYRATRMPVPESPSAHRASEARARRASEAVSRQLLGPLMPHIKDFRRWIISPSDRTWIEPWGALVLEDGSYAIESHAISYLMTGRDLIEPARSATDEPPGPPLILANPNYDRGGPKSGPGRGMFAPLPNTETEAKAIAPRIEAYTGTRPRLLLGDQAREEALHLDRSPRVLVASTHGFYGVLRGTGITMSNPLLRCGLALTGANYRRVDAPKRPGMDGIATGLEVLGLDLRGTDLVVLSACESGKGDVLASQGMIGMNVAFQLAGARSVLATLWPIPDEETVTLISELFRHLADGQTKDEALRRAQVSLIRSLRKTRGVAHPSLWASFQMIGSLSSHPR